MSLRALVESGVNLAYDVIGDLKTVVLFKHKSSHTYDFNTSQTVTSTLPDIKMGVVMEKVETMVKDDGLPIYKTKLIANKQDLPETYSMIDTVVIDGEEKSIGSIVDDDYTVQFWVS